MPAKSLRDLDLNLLVVFDALMEERNVTRAAQRLGMSQPAVSSALRRLRRHFHDPLLERVRNRYVLSPLAAQLREPTATVLAGVERVFSASAGFDPSVDSREFTLIVSDYAATVFGDLLVTLAAHTAPRVRFRLTAQSHTDVDEAAASLRTVDGMVLPRGLISDLPATDLYSDGWVLVVSEDNPDVGESVTLTELAEVPWVVTHHGPTAFTPAVRQLRMLGVEPRVEVVVESFLPVPFLVAGTARVALLQRGLAARLGRAAGVRVVECPWEVIPLVEALWWHPSHATDPAHAWMRRLAVEAGRQVGAPPD